MKKWILSLGRKKFQIIHALIWAVAILSVNSIGDRLGWQGNYVPWLAVGYFLVNGIATTLIFGKPETEK